MKKTIILAILFCLILIHGCVPFERRIAVMHIDKQYYSFDLSKGNDTGRLLLSCSPPGSQIIDHYVIEIDNNEPAEVYKYCDADFILDVGRHTIKIYVTEEKFGKELKKDIEIAKDTTLYYEYIGPYWFGSMGNLKEIRLREDF